MPKRFFIRTFGCKTNQYEAQAIRELLLGGGYTESPSLGDASIIFINTCAVTGRAGASCRRAIHQARRAAPQSRIVMLGCAVDTQEPWIPEMDDVDVLISNTDKPQLLSLLENSVQQPSETKPWGLQISRFEGHHRGFVKIQDGCDTYCSYCIIPKARGVPRSRPVADILAECRRLVAAGHQELVLTGINIGMYNAACGTTLPALLQRISTEVDCARIRLGSVEPNWINEDLLQVMAATARICPHLHIPLQAGSDATLQAMRRRYDLQAYADTIAQVRHYLDKPGITTDVIVGFPTETTTHFEETAAYCKTVGFSRIHVFPFSPRNGTPAATLRPAASNREVSQRKEILLKIAHQTTVSFAQSLIGRKTTLLPETQTGEMIEGYTDRYLLGRAPAEQCEAGSPTSVLVEGLCNETLICSHDSSA